MTGSAFQNRGTPPRVSVSSSCAAYVGPGLDLSPHRNAAATVAIALERAFELRFTDFRNDPGPTIARGIALIPPGTLHRVRTHGAMVFDSLAAANDDHRRLTSLDLEDVHRRLNAAAPAGFSDVDTICRTLGVPQTVAKASPVADVVRLIDRRPQDFPRTAAAARAAGFSVSRFPHLFQDSTGMPLRRYRLWRRMAVVRRVLATGGSLTAAAHEAGISSSAHLSAPFRAMSGLRPSDLIALGTTFDVPKTPPSRGRRRVSFHHRLRGGSAPAGRANREVGWGGSWAAARGSLGEGWDGMRRHDRATRATVTPRQALGFLREGNNRFLGNLAANRDLLAQVNETRDGQFPFAAILSCIDSRTSAELIFDQGLGDIFSIRLAGNVVTPEVLGSMEFACKLAGSKLVVVLGHTRCGAIMGACDGVRLGHLSPLLDLVQPAIDAERTVVDNRTSENAVFVDRVTRNHVARGVEAVLDGSPVMREMIGGGAVGLVGGLYDVGTGKVEFLEETFVAGERKASAAIVG